MRRAFLVFVFLLVSSALFADVDPFQLTFGANLSFEKINLTDRDDADILDITKDSFSLGLDLRMIFKYVQLGFVGNMSVIDKQTLLLNGLSYVGPTVRVFKIVDLGFAFGPNVNYMHKDHGESKYVDGEGDTDSSISNYFTAIYQGHFSYRLTAEAMISKVMKVGVAVTVPTHFSLQYYKFSKLWPEASDFKNIKFSLSVQMRLI